MPVTCVIGLQWGDEAKGKIVDLLTGQHDVVVRYQGGANAGHTVVWGAETYKFSLLPSGILTPSVTCVIGSGMVINPATLLDELDSLQTRAVGETAPLLISDRAHVIFPWHLAEDHALDENTADGERIGTTQRGIGPCYRDKVGRTHAVRVGDLLRDGLREKIERIVEAKRQVLAAVGEPAAAVALDPAAIDQQYRAYAERLRPHVADTTEYLMTAAEAGQRILLEGAQGSMLDVDHGTYPFVTSSNSSAVGVSSGTGLPPRYLTRVIGVMKAYSTRVGGGPFPTELLDATGQHLRERGREYGTVTNRPRRCGWIDTVALRYAARLGGIDTLCVTLLDVLSELTELKLCVAYEVDGQRTTTFPSHVDDLRRAVPVYETVAGWRDDISAVRSFDELPAAARHYLGRLRALVGCPVQIVSVGRDREQTIYHDV
ncbi:MAG: adenylosuccinate synthase [Planctomycetes bacterium RBG_16_64_10]|nr:MAG: adenylosuccinate synthase [Planctomycetes bacterium RBG_16_64_10]